MRLLQNPVFYGDHQAIVKDADETTLQGPGMHVNITTLYRLKLP